MAANELKKKAGRKARVILIVKNPHHIYTPSFCGLYWANVAQKRFKSPSLYSKEKGLKL